MDAPSVETTAEEEGDDLDLQADGKDDPLEQNETEGQQDIDLSSVTEALEQTQTEEQLDIDLSSMNVKTPNRADNNKVTIDNNHSNSRGQFIGDSRWRRQLGRRGDTTTRNKYLMPTDKINISVISNIISLQFFLLTSAIFYAILTMNIHVNNYYRCCIIGLSTSKLTTGVYNHYVNVRTLKSSMNRTYPTAQPLQKTRNQTKGVSMTTDDVYHMGSSADPDNQTFPRSELEHVYSSLKLDNLYPPIKTPVPLLVLLEKPG